MTKPSLFIINTDYASLGNDDGTTLSIIAPAGVIAGSGYAEYHADVLVGVQASLNRIQISSSKDSSNRYSTQNLSFSRTGDVLGFASTYSIFAFATRIAPSTLRCQVYVPNPYTDPLTTEAGSETFIFYIDTFIPPFA